MICESAQSEETLFVSLRKHIIATVFLIFGKNVRNDIFDI